jgi:soluble lytic murein transglycosylase-like protein
MWCKKYLMVILITLAFLLSSVFFSIASAFCFKEAGNEHGINPFLLKVISDVESGGNPQAINVNANGTMDIGLMQINTFWVSRRNLDYNLLLSDPCYNVKVGAGILRQCIDRYGYGWKAIGCYNAVSEEKQVTYSWKVYNVLKRKTHIPEHEDKSEFSIEIRDLSGIRP